jgi:hypothetical protein
MYELFDIIFFTDEITSNPIILTFEDTISLTDGVFSSPFSTALRDGITLSDDMAASCVHARTFADGLSFYEWTHPRTHVVGFEDFLYLPEWFDRIPYNLYDTLSLTDEMIGSKDGAHDAITFTDVMEVELVRVYALADSLVLTEGMPFYFLDPWRM